MTSTCDWVNDYINLKSSVVWIYHHMEHWQKESHNLISFEKQHADSDRNQDEENRRIIKNEPEYS